MNTVEMCQRMVESIVDTPKRVLVVGNIGADKIKELNKLFSGRVEFILHIPKKEPAMSIIIDECKKIDFELYVRDIDEKPNLSKIQYKHKKWESPFRFHR